jgi:hypothetical protein
MNSWLRSFVVFFLFAHSLVATAGAMTLSFLGDLNIPTGAKFEGTDVGGLSGLAFDPIDDTLYVISDDRSDHQPARYYTAKISVTPGRIQFEPTSITTLLQKNGSTFPKGKIDPEAIALLSPHHIFVSSEGNGHLDPRVMPAIFETDGAGKVLTSLSVPEKYLPESTGPQTRGVVDNCAFESLALTPSHQSLFTATECPLVQDDTPSTFEKGSLSRILQFHLQGNHRIPAAEFLYATEPNAHPSDANEDYGNGISEMLALNDNQLLVLERGTAGTPRGAIGRARIFLATLGGGATNVAGVESIRGRNVRPVKKSLLLDLNAVLPQLDPKWRSLDNLEGMTFGPTLPNGHRTLLLISDNNFNLQQRTQILAFEIGR